MSEGELPERPRGTLTTEQRGLSKERERGNSFAAEIAGEKPPYSHNVFDRVYKKLANAMDDYPSQDWYWSQLDDEAKDDTVMVTEGFLAIAYDHVGGALKARLQDMCYEAATGDSAGDYPLLTPKDVTENRRIYHDRIELTVRQAKAVQKTMRYLQENYDPGRAEPTPENLAKRTFYYDAYLGRPIPKDHPEQPETLMAKPQYEREIAEYVQSRKAQARTPLKA
jgi:hypothetical protein